MPRSYYGQFPEGVQIAGININVHTKGQIYYVCNSSVAAKYGAGSSDANSGLSPDYPLATIKQAITNCVASRGDKIILMPGHAESVSAAAGIDFNKAGIEIIGVGEGAQRPKITLGTANTATVRISAADISITNVLFVANFLNIAACVVITTGKDAKFNKVEFRDTSAILNFVKAIQTDSTDNHADGLSVRQCDYNGLGTSATTSLINAQGAIDRLYVSQNKVDVQGTTATSGALILATSKAMTHLYCEDNDVMSNLTTTAAGAMIVAGTGCSGIVKNNSCICVAGPTDLLCTASTGLGFVNNYFQGAADASGYLLPAADV